MTAFPRVNNVVSALLIATYTVVLGSPAFGGRYDRADYGRRIEGIGGDTAVWWCEATWKIAPDRAAPQVASPAATFNAGAEGLAVAATGVAETTSLSSSTPPTTAVSMKA